MEKVESIDVYIAQAEPNNKKLLKQLQACIQQAAPMAVECIKYGMPTFFYQQNLVHFAGWKTHIGFYPTPGALLAFKKDLTRYNQSKGAVQFPSDEPLPLDLITRMVKFRVRQVEEKMALKATANKKNTSKSTKKVAVKKTVQIKKTK